MPRRNSSSGLPTVTVTGYRRSKLTQILGRERAHELLGPQKDYPKTLNLNELKAAMERHTSLELDALRKSIADDGRRDREPSTRTRRTKRTRAATAA